MYQNNKKKEHPTSNMGQESEAGNSSNRSECGPIKFGLATALVSVLAYGGLTCAIYLAQWGVYISQKSEQIRSIQEIYNKKEEFIAGHFEDSFLWKPRSSRLDGFRLQQAVKSAERELKQAKERAKGIFDRNE